MSGTFAVLCITLAIQVMTSLSMLAVPVLASTAAADVGVSATYVGIYVSLVYFGAMIASLFGGSLREALGLDGATRAAVPPAALALGRVATDLAGALAGGTMVSLRRGATAGIFALVAERPWSFTSEGRTFRSC